MKAGKSIDEILTLYPDGPARVVSLVPSYTDSMIDLGFEHRLVGVTDYCQPDDRLLPGLTRIGGVWDARDEEIIRLRPDLVLANQEENKPELIHRLENAGLNVWLTFPRSVVEMFEMLSGIATLYHDEAASLKIRMLETSLDWLAQAASDQRRVRYFCPIWQDRSPEGERWWMTFNRQTYAGDLLGLMSGANSFENRERRYPLSADLGKADAENPGTRDVRYPRVTPGEVIAAQPEVILLPDEPFVFDDAACRGLMEDLRETPAVRAGWVYQVDGRMLAWYGTRIKAALDTLPRYFLI